MHDSCASEAGLYRSCRALWCCGNALTHNRDQAKGCCPGGLTSGLVLCVHVEDTVGIHVEADIDLGDPSPRRGDPAQLELAQQVVVARAAALPLVDLYQDAWLVVRVGTEGLHTGRKGVGQGVKAVYASSSCSVAGLVNTYFLRLTPSVPERSLV